MDGSIRVSAKTVDDAITEALIQLGVTSDRLEYEVIEKGSSGFLGIGMKQAVIEARRKPEPVAEVKEETIPVEEVKPSVVKAGIRACTGKAGRKSRRGAGKKESYRAGRSF